MDQALKNELEELLTLSLEKNTSQEQVDRLNAILDEDPEALNHCLDFYSMVAYLNQSREICDVFLNELNSECDTQIRFLKEMAEFEKTAPIIEISEEKPKRELIQKVVYPQREKRKLSKFQLFTLMVSFAAMFFIALFIGFVPPRRPGVDVAALIDQIDAVWDENMQIPGTDGRMLQDTYSLTSGYATFCLDNQAQITVEAPAEFSLISTDDVKLIRGRIYSVVPPQAQGFTVKTNNSKIVDLGTEFGVEVDSYNNTQVHVIKGRTILFAGLPNSNKKQFELSEGKAKKVYNDGYVKDIEVIEDEFVRKIDSDSKMIFKGEPVTGKQGFVAYHDFGAISGQESKGNITTHHSGSGELGYDYNDSPRALITYADGSETGVLFSINRANAIDSRDEGQVRPPATGTPAYSLFNVPGLNLNNGNIGVGNTDSRPENYEIMTLTLRGLDPGMLYDLAFYGDRSETRNTGLDRFTLGGADTAVNISSTGVIDRFTTEMETSKNADRGHVIRWMNIDPGADGIITVKVDAGFYGEENNIVYLTAMRLEALAPGEANYNSLINE
ncbi:FecR protein [Anaerohalosphaera lusitana]|uniref:FecR protein n=1 Tax=Anaerohalosphaera lusitana TaxID=1936003 RepID=A0A1U9NJU9_9BACT|nr:FecR domain-containing protein [Anaerohalosphaera lusitana]AQT68095.1 FecR protein [Anaerohalosphaera lusitana]